MTIRASAIGWIIFSPLALLTNLVAVLVVCHYHHHFHFVDATFISVFVTTIVEVLLIVPVATFFAFQNDGFETKSHSPVLCRAYIGLFMTLYVSRLLITLEMNLYWMWVQRCHPTRQVCLTITGKRFLIACAWIVAILIGITSVSARLFSNFNEDTTGPKIAKFHTRRDQRICTILQEYTTNAFNVVHVVTTMVIVFISLLSSVDSLIVMRSMKRLISRECSTEIIPTTHSSTDVGEPSTLAKDSCLLSVKASSISNSHTIYDDSVISNNENSSSHIALSRFKEHASKCDGVKNESLTVKYSDVCNNDSQGLFFHGVTEVEGNNLKKKAMDLFNGQDMSYSTSASNITMALSALGMELHRVRELCRLVLIFSCVSAVVYFIPISIDKSVRLTGTSPLHGQNGQRLISITSDTNRQQQRLFLDTGQRIIRRNNNIGNDVAVPKVNKVSDGKHAMTAMPEILPGPRHLTEDSLQEIECDDQHCQHCRAICDCKLKREQNVFPNVPTSTNDRQYLVNNSDNRRHDDTMLTDSQSACSDDILHPKSLERNNQLGYIPRDSIPIRSASYADSRPHRRAGVYCDRRRDSGVTSHRGDRFDEHGERVADKPTRRTCAFNSHTMRHENSLAVDVNKSGQLKTVPCFLNEAFEDDCSSFAKTTFNGNSVNGNKSQRDTSNNKIGHGKTKRENNDNVLHPRSILRRHSPEKAKSTNYPNIAHYSGIYETMLNGTTRRCGGNQVDENNANTGINGKHGANNDCYSQTLPHNNLTLRESSLRYQTSTLSNGQSDNDNCAGKSKAVEKAVCSLRQLKPVFYPVFESVGKTHLTSLNEGEHTTTKISKAESKMKNVFVEKKAISYPRSNSRQEEKINATESVSKNIDTTTVRKPRANDGGNSIQRDDLINTTNGDNSECMISLKSSTNPLSNFLGDRKVNQDIINLKSNEFLSINNSNHRSKVNVEMTKESRDNGEFRYQHDMVHVKKNTHQREKTAVKNMSPVQHDNMSCRASGIKQNSPCEEIPQDGRQQNSPCEEIPQDGRQQSSPNKEISNYCPIEVSPDADHHSASSSSTVDTQSTTSLRSSVRWCRKGHHSHVNHHSNVKAENGACSPIGSDEVRRLSNLPPVPRTQINICLQMMTDISNSDIKHRNAESVKNEAFRPTMNPSQTSEDDRRCNAVRVRLVVTSQPLEQSGSDLCIARIRHTNNDGLEIQCQCSSPIEKLVDMHEDDTHHVDTYEDDTHHVDTHHANTHQVDTHEDDSHQADTHHVNTHQLSYGRIGEQADDPDTISLNKIINCHSTIPQHKRTLSEISRMSLPDGQNHRAEDVLDNSPQNIQHVCKECTYVADGEADSQTTCPQMTADDGSHWSGAAHHQPNTIGSHWSGAAHHQPNTIGTHLYTSKMSDTNDIKSNLVVYF